MHAASLVTAPRADAEAVAVAARLVSSDTPVPTCQAWTVARLVRHVGSGQPLGEALAADGIDEATTLCLGTHRPPAEDAGGRVVALRAAGREWRVGLHER